jgi:hypothetical protein
MAIILKANKVNLFVSCVFVCFLVPFTEPFRKATYIFNHNYVDTRWRQYTTRSVDTRFQQYTTRSVDTRCQQYTTRSVDTRCQQYTTRSVDTRCQQYTTHLHTNNTQNTEKGEFETCWSCPVFASYTLAFALQLRENHGETSVRVAQYKNNEIQCTDEKQ